MNISYTKKGDYLLPNLILEDKEQFNIEKYGLLRLEYIKSCKYVLYIDLLINDTLNEYLHDIETTVMENNQMLWVSKMNNIKNIAEEIILKEYIYV